jgi:hypothetical protein
VKYSINNYSIPKAYGFESTERCKKIIYKEESAMISTIVRNNNNLIVEAIYAHLKEYTLSPFSYELRMYVDETGTVSLKSEPGITCEIWNGEYYVLCSVGGLFSPWHILGNVFACLREDDEEYVLDELPFEKRVHRSSVEAFIEDKHPEMIAKWLAEFHENHYEDGIEAAEEILERFLDNVDGIEFENDINK